MIRFLAVQTDRYPGNEAPHPAGQVESVLRKGRLLVRDSTFSPVRDNSVSMAPSITLSNGLVNAISGRRTRRFRQMAKIERSAHAHRAQRRPNALRIFC